MKAKEKKSSLRATLESLASTAPVNPSFDPEAISDEALGFDTLDYDQSNEYDQFDDDMEPTAMSSMRRRSEMELALDEDPKYAGKRVSVSDLKEHGVLLDDSESDDGEMGSDIEFDEMSFDSQSTSDGSEDDEPQEEPGAAYQPPKVRLTGDIERDTEAELQALAAADAQALSRYKSVEMEDAKKGLAVRNQISDIEHALEFRIQLQQALSLSHKLPRHPQMDEYKASSKKIAAAYSELRDQCADIVLEALYLQSASIASTPKLADSVARSLKLDAKRIEDKVQNIEQYLLPEPAHDMALLSGTKRHRLSTLDEDGDENSDDDSGDKKRFYGADVSTEQLWESVSRCWTSIGSWRDETLDSWGRKLMLTSGLSSRAAQKLKVIGTDISEQVAESMENIERLISRTRLKKGAVQVIGQPSVAEDPTNEDSNEVEIDEETYDDADFYANLLKDYISLTASSEQANRSGGGINAKQGYVRTTRKNVDRRASKARKLKFVVHPKLVNFCAPAPFIVPQEHAVDVDTLLKSLWQP